MRTIRVCAVCGKDLYRKKVWEKFGKKVIGYCCMSHYTFCRDGNIRRREDDDPSVPKVKSQYSAAPETKP